MSIKIMSKIWDECEQKGSSLLLLLAIADYADDYGVAWPSVSTLAKKIRMSERHTKRLLSGLVEDGDLLVDRSQYHNHYVVITGMNKEAIITSLMAKLGYDLPEARRVATQAMNQNSDKMSPNSEDGAGAGAVDGDNLSVDGDNLSTNGDADVTLTIISPKETSNDPSEDEDVRAPAKKTARPSMPKRAASQEIAHEPANGAGPEDDTEDAVLSAVFELYEQELGGTMSPMLRDELLELTAQERDLSRWRKVFRDSVGKQWRWAWIRKVIRNPRGGAKRASGYRKRKEAKKPPPAKRKQQIVALIKARNANSE